jgi:nicotinamidase-related amidase
MTYHEELAIPRHFDPAKVGEVWRVPYQDLVEEAESWARDNNILPFHKDRFKLSLLLVDVQNTFCIPGYELFVQGESGMGAVEDNGRICEFIYRNLDIITDISPTMDTHRAAHIFHGLFLVDKDGIHPPPFTTVSVQDIENGVWKFNRELAPTLEITEEYGQEYLRHYVQQLRESGKYDLTVWPYHAMLGGIGHALVSAVEESVFFHNVARRCQTGFRIKGSESLTEYYSVLCPEVLTGPQGQAIAEKNQSFIDKLFKFDAVVIAGQAKSHCVAWTIDDLLKEIEHYDKGMAEKVYLLEDCSSPVVIPGVADFSKQADEAYRRFADAGMHVVRSTDPLGQWPGIKL